MTDPFDDEVRAALRTEAEGVTADPALLDRIRSASRPNHVGRRRVPWLLAAAAVALIAGTAAMLVAADDDDQRVDVTDDPDESSPTSIEPAPGVTDLGLWCDVAALTDVAVFMEAGTHPAEHDAARDAIERDPRVQAVRYVDIDESYEIFVETFADQPELLVAVTPEDVPAAFLVDLTDADTTAAAADDFATIDGVYESLPEPCPTSVDPVDRPAQIVAVTEQGHVVVVDSSTGEVIRDLGGFEDPTDPAVADREGGGYSITGVALHPNGRDVYFETCCEPAAGAIFRVPIDGSVSINTSRLVPVTFGFGIDISEDGRWLAFASPAGPGLRDLETGDEVHGDAGDGFSDLVQVAVNRDGTEVTAERALEYSPGDEPFRVIRSELIAFRRDGDTLSRGETTGGDVRLLPIYSAGGTELTTVTARDGLIDLNVDATGRWFLATPFEMPLRGYTTADDEQQIPGSYVAADW